MMSRLSLDKGCQFKLLAWLGLALGLGALSGMAAAPMAPGTNSTTVSATPSARPSLVGGRRPSIILILADDLGYGDLGCYGQSKIKTPNLDRMAQEGIRFTDFYAGCTVCAPSRCALMTGKHTGHCTIRGNDKTPLRPEDTTLAQVLKAAGYHTGLVGKWGLGDEGSPGVPQKKGFDEFVGYLDQTHAHDYYTDHLWRYDGKSGFDGQVLLSENEKDMKGTYTHDLFTKAALNFIRINKPEKANHQRPFFLYLAYTIPHANNEQGKRSGNGMEVPSDEPYSGESWPQPEKNKAAMITRLDRDVGAILDQLKELKIDDNTLVLFMSDNGPHKEGGVDPKFFQSSGPLRGIKRDLYEGGIRVPLLVRWPFRIHAGQVSGQVWAFWDMLPTLTELAGAEPLSGVDGISMLPALLGQKQTQQHEYLYWQFHEGGFKQAVRTGDWKGVQNGKDKPLELYDLKSDLGETKDVAAQNPDVVARIEQEMKTAQTPGKEKAAN